MIIFASAKSDY